MKKNLIYQTLYQILLLILPFITTPYISRVLSVEGVGESSYVLSIINYFEIFAALGIPYYGNRKISQLREDKKLRDIAFWEIVSFRFLASAVTIIVYVSYLLIFHHYDILSWICIIDLMAVAIDISWYFFGIEEFKFTALRNAVIKICSVIAVFMLVKERQDVWLYTLITCLSNFVSQACLWVWIVKRIRFYAPSWAGIMQHKKLIFVLFIPVIAISLYKIMDKVMLGYISGDAEVGFYYSTEKIMHIPTAVISALTTVMMPRISNLVKNNKEDEVIRLMNLSVDFISFASVSLCFGIMAIAPQFIPVFLGKGYEKCIFLTYILAPATIVVSFEQIIRAQYLTPTGRDKEFIKSTFLGAAVNFICNASLIPQFGAVGAAFGTLFAEISVLFYQFFIVRKNLPIRTYLCKYTGYIIIGCIMFTTLFFYNLTMDFGFRSIFFEMAIGGIIFVALSIPYMIYSKSAIFIYVIDFLKKK